MFFGWLSNALQWASQLLFIYSQKLPFRLIAYSDVAGLGFSGFGRARAFLYRASGGPGFFVSGFGPISGFLKG